MIFIYFISSTLIFILSKIQIIHYDSIKRQISMWPVTAQHAVAHLAYIFFDLFDFTVKFSYCPFKELKLCILIFMHCFNLTW